MLPCFDRTTHTRCDLRDKPELGVGVPCNCCRVSSTSPELDFRPHSTELSTLLLVCRICQYGCANSARSIDYFGRRYLNSYSIKAKAKNSNDVHTLMYISSQKQLGLDNDQGVRAVRGRAAVRLAQGCRTTVYRQVRE